MIQLNLLPDVKLQYVRAQRSRRLVLTIAFLAAAASLALLILLLGVSGLQKKHLSDLRRDIASETNKLQDEPQINKILTVQNQLESLTTLHDGKPAASRLFDYLNQLTPAQVNITSFNIDFAQQTATITGTGDTLSSINKYIDTLKYTTYTSDADSKSAPAFTNIVLGSFGLNGNTKDTSQVATYTITLAYDKNIFDITKAVKLSVPNLITTRSELDKPTELFKAVLPSPAAGGSQ